MGRRRVLSAVFGAAARQAARRGEFSSAYPGQALNEPRDRLFNKLLIANRGEIAVRVMRTAKRLGIPTVAVYSDADVNAVHTRYADEAVRLGPPPSAESYLRIDAVLEAMEKTGADAVHPGYGFLSENAHFAEAVERAGKTFIGPPMSAVAAMGDKVASKQFARQASVNIIPGWVGVVDGPEHAVAVARDIGFPVMIKASAGGGGKGMRIAWSEAEVLEGYALATQEAASAFGDSRMLIEKYIEQPRHIEIQVMGDKHGNVVYFPERECSIQRRNQKVIEEAPSPLVTQELRRAMGEQATALCRAVGYFSAGTCEFLVDKHRHFYFLEMNTRLQVEHPITEAITRQDLVEHMLRVAAGQRLAISQEQALDMRGWAMECRVYAEDPARGFLPSIGRLQRYRAPQGEGIRVDSGVLEGSEISMYYDPLISKTVAFGPDRPAALARMRRALDTYIIRGVQHNVPLLRSVLDMPDFVAGDISTDFLHLHYPRPEDSDPRVLPLSQQQQEELLAMAAMLHVERECRLSGSRPLTGPQDLVLSLGEEQVPVTVEPAGLEFVPPSRRAGPQALRVTLPRRVLEVTCPVPGGTAGMLMDVLIDGEVKTVQQLASSPRTFTLQYCGAHRRVAVDTPLGAQLMQHMPKAEEEDTSKVIRSPMPGALVSVSVQAGDEVEPGDEVAVVEAMKMRNSLKSQGHHRVKSVECQPGSVVAADQVIVRFE